MLRKGFDAYTDHLNIVHWMNQTNSLNPRVARWVLFMQDFKVTIHHKPGLENIIADAISRQPGVFFIGEPNFSERLMSAYLLDKFTAPAVEKSESAAKYRAYYGLQKSEGALLYKGRIYVPNSARDLIKEILYGYHANYSWIHPGVNETYYWIKKYFVWESIKQDVVQFVKTCEVCQRGKQLNLTYGELVPHGIPNGKWKVWTVDWSDMPNDNGYDNLLVVVDKFSKMTILIPQENQKTTAQHSLDNLKNKVVRYFGIPERIIGDRDVRLRSQEIVTWAKSLGIDIRLSPEYRERYHREIAGIQVRACFNCGSPDHFARQCTQVKTEFCTNCKGKGHKFATCPNIICRKCNEKGHIQISCRSERFPAVPKVPTNQTTTTTSTTTTQSANLGANKGDRPRQQPPGPGAGAGRGMSKKDKTQEVGGLANKAVPLTDQPKTVVECPNCKGNHYAVDCPNIDKDTAVLPRCLVCSSTTHTTQQHGWDKDKFIVSSSIPPSREVIYDAANTKFNIVFKSKIFEENSRFQNLEIVAAKIFETCKVEIEAEVVKPGTDKLKIDNTLIKLHAEGAHIISDYEEKYGSVDRNEVELLDKITVPQLRERQMTRYVNSYIEYEENRNRIRKMEQNLHAPLTHKKESTLVFVGRPVYTFPALA